MMMKPKPYPEYKDSGIPWIGKIPEGWEVRKIKHFSRLFTGSTPDSGNEKYWDGNITWVTPADLSVQQKFIKESKRTISHEGYINSGTNFVNVGAIILATRAPIGYPTIVGTKLCFNQGCKAFEIKRDFFSDYIYYFLNAGIDVLVSKGNVTTFGELSSYDLISFHVLMSPLPDQIVIANFLDKKVAEIDVLIEKDKRLIALLKEKRTALINHAVTKGLDPNAKMKDSEIEWIGEIPEGWEVCIIKNKTDKITDGAHVSPELDNGTYPFISTVNVKNGKIDFVNCLLTSGENYRLLKAQGCKPERGDILYSKDGTIGETVMVNEEKEFVVASSLIIIRPNVKLVKSDFLNYLFQSSIIFDRINSLVKGSALRRISLTNIKRVYGLFPPKTEQTAIANFLDKATSKIDKTIKFIEKKIKLLEEYKKSLVNHVVTGKVDVRKSEV